MITSGQSGTTIEEVAAGIYRIDTPHLPHAQEYGLMIDDATATFFCSDPFSHGGLGGPALTETDILGPSKAFRSLMDYYAETLPRLWRNPESGSRQAGVSCARKTNWESASQSSQEQREKTIPPSPREGSEAAPVCA